MHGQLLIRIEDKKKEKLSRLARLHGKSTSQLIREIIDRYLNEQDIEVYIDDLWGRIGKKLKEKGITLSNVQRAIQEYRKEKK